MRLLVDLQGAQGSSRRAGLGRYTLELLRAMLRHPRGHDVAVLLNTALADSAAELGAEFRRALGRANVALWQAPPGSAAGTAPRAPLRRAAALLRAEAALAAKPDVLHVTSVFEGWDRDAVAVWPDEWTRPAMAATHYDLIPLSLRPLYLDGLWRAAGLVPFYEDGVRELAEFDRLLCISEATRAEALRFLPLRPDQLPVIGGGVSPGFAPPEAPDPALPARTGAPPGCVLFLGAGDLRKNEGALIQAFAALPEGLRRAHPLCIGHTSRAHLQAQFDAAGLGPHEAIALPFVADDDLPGLYASCALLVFPSLAEGFGLPLLEAMACGAPVLAARAGALPEILTRDDALFDPADIPALTALLRRWLEDPDARAELAAHGRRRAREFSWEGVASRAWDALEGISPRPARRKPRLAFVSPLPPAPSGIADYAAELAPALAAHYAVTLVSPAPPEGALAARFPWIAQERFPDAAPRFSRVLVQMGNNLLHADALRRLLPRLPAVVTLHDARLADLWNNLNDPASRAAEDGIHALFGAPDATGAGPVLEAARRVIVHSGHAKALLEHAHGLPAIGHVSVIPHLRAPAPLPPRAEARAALGVAPGEFLVCSFGLVTRRKLPGVAAAAVAGMDGARLVFVGEALPGQAPPRAHVTGRVDQAAYRQWLAAADAAVQLREGSTGETSGAVLDVLMAGVPLVTNRHGALAELPEGAAKLLDDPPGPEGVRDALRAIRRDPAVGRAGRDWARWALDPAQVARAYEAVIEDGFRDDPAAPFHGLQLTPDEAAALAPAFWLGEDRARLPPRQPRLWLDATLAPEGEVLEVLRRGCPPFRAEPVRMEDGRPLHALSWAFARLGLSGAPADAPALFGRDDAIVARDPALLRLAEALGLAPIPWPGRAAALRAKLRRP